MSMAAAWRGSLSSLHCSNLISQFSQRRRRSHVSPFESNLFRIISNQIQCLSDYSPPHARYTFNILRRKFGEDEHIKIEATMFDGLATVQKSSDESIGEDVQLHISVLVDIWKGEGSEFLEFVCSSWPNSLEVQKVYVLRNDESPAEPYMGPNVKELNSGLRDGLNEFLKTRGISDEISEFLHEFMTNKDRTEAIEWLRKIQSFFEN